MVLLLLFMRRLLEFWLFLVFILINEELSALLIIRFRLLLSSCVLVSAYGLICFLVEAGFKLPIQAKNSAELLFFGKASVSAAVYCLGISVNVMKAYYS